MSREQAREVYSCLTSFKEDSERETGILGWGRGGKASTDEAPIAQLKSSRPGPGLQSRKPQLLHSEQGYNNHLE